MNSNIPAAQRAQLFDVRRILDKYEKGMNLTDESAFNAAAAIINEDAAAFRVWLENGDYQRGDVRIDPADNVPYWAIHSHGAASGHICQPSKTPSMWAHCHGTSPETARPFVAESYNLYQQGHYCTEHGAVFLCLANNTVHAPGVLPSAWKQVEI